MFGLLFIYMIICVVMYLTTEHTTAYEVTAGTLSNNYHYTALSVRTEKLVNATQSGTVSYYAREGNKVGTGSIICSIDESGKLAEAISTNTINSESNLTPTALKELKTNFSSFSINFNSTDFQSVYDFKADTESGIIEMTSEQSLSEIGELQGGVSSLVNLFTAEQEGIVVYSVDGYEDLQVEDITIADFNKKNHTRSNLRVNSVVKSGEPLYKLLTDEKWSLMIPVLDKRMAAELSEQKNVRFRFVKDGAIFTSAFSLIQNGDDFFGKIDMQNSLIRYATNRHLDIELLLNKTSGLKIPKSAIANRIFYQIPKEYAVFEEEHPVEIGLLRESYNKDGSAVTNYLNATVYDADDDNFYVDISLFNEGDYVLMQDSSERFQVNETATLQGVYNINKGYAIFREITIIDENEEFCIIQDGSTFGLSHYDYIALNAETVTDEQLLR